jgi:carboxylesterase
LHEHGFTVDAPLLSGHGTHISDMVGTGWRDWLRDAGAAAHAIGRSGRRLHIVGLSMGAILGILTAPTFDAVTLTTINAPLRVFSRRVHLAGFYRGSDRILEESPPLPFRDEAQRYAHQYDDNPVGTVAELFDLVRAAQASLRRVSCPTLVVQSRVDETVRPESAEILMRGLGSLDKRILWLQDSRHVAILDKERHVVFDATIDHLERHLQPPD